jgi:hypothetical protein
VENETQKRQTYEIVAKYVAEHAKVTVELNDEGLVCADPVKGHIKIPRNIKADNIYPAIAWMIHEASHIKHTKHIQADKIVDDQVDFHILNACEDVRIDREAFTLLPNVNGIYKEMLKIIDLKGRVKDKNIPIEVKVLSDCIMILEGFQSSTSQDSTVNRFIKDTQLLMEIELLIQRLWDIEWSKGGDPNQFKEAKKQVKVIRKILSNIKEEHQKQQPKDGSSNGPQGDPKGQGQSPNGTDKSPCPSKGKNKSNDGLDLEQMEGSTAGGTSKKVFGELDSNATGSPCLGTASLHEQTEQAFKEMLNQKVIQRVDNGHVIDTDNLCAFFTGDIEELFKDEIVTHQKKSKLLLVLDCSGSMYEVLLDGSRRAQTVADTAKSITNILDDVHMLEGINVDYAVRRFNSAYYELPKDTWQADYLKVINGGTNIVHAFDKASEELIKDTTIEGKKLIVFITDGDVTNDQLESIRKSIMKSASDVRAMVLGVGAEINGGFVKNVSGHNIISKELADVVLMTAITEMLD